MDVAILFKILPYLMYGVGSLLAIGSSVMVYSGLSTHTERLQHRLRIKQTYQERKEKLIDSANKSEAEKWMKRAKYPLGLNSLRYYTLYYGFIAFLTIYYVLIPIMLGNTLNWWAIVGIVAILILFLPNFPYSLFVYVMKRVIDYQEAKKNAEIFMLYDLLINELEMMSTSRINTYNILRNIKPYFHVIDPSLNKLLASWSNNEGPSVALDNFTKEIGTKEGKSLVSVMRTLDDVEIDTALDSLRGMNNMFVRSQIENYRRRRKITIDLSNIPIKATHFLIILNFLLVIIMMVSKLMDGTEL